VGGKKARVMACRCGGIRGGGDPYQGGNDSTFTTDRGGKTWAESSGKSMKRTVETMRTRHRGFGSRDAVKVLAVRDMSADRARLD